MKDKVKVGIRVTVRVGVKDKVKVRVRVTVRVRVRDMIVDFGIVFRSGVG